MGKEHELRIVLTPFCNYRCFFCHGEGIVEESTALMLSPQDYGFAVSAAKKLWGWDSATITGGEPLVSPIYQEVCEAIAKEGVAITTVTNASLVSDPGKIFANNKQVNISIHTMDPMIYRKITGSSYPLSRIIDTITAIRAYCPEMIIHLNVTVIRGINDGLAEMEKIIKFASMIDGRVKFIDLASENQNMVVSCEEIESSLVLLGFSKYYSNKWQTFLERGSDCAIVTRCGFSRQNVDLGYRDLFLNPDGTIDAGGKEGFRMNVLREIYLRDIDGFGRKAELCFPPVRSI